VVFYATTLQPPSLTHTHKQTNIMMNTNPPPQQQQLLAQTEKSDADDYLQVLDAGEHMFGMFVASDEDLYAYLDTPEEPLWNSISSTTEDIEDVISRSIGPGNVNGLDAMHHEHCTVVEGCCCASFADMHIRAKIGIAEVSGCQDDSDNESTNTGRLTPTRNEDDDAMTE